MQKGIANARCSIANAQCMHAALPMPSAAGRAARPPRAASQGTGDLDIKRPPPARPPGAAPLHEVNDRPGKQDGQRPNTEAKERREEPATG